MSLADIRNSSTPTPSAVAGGECASVVSGTKRSTRTAESSRSKGEGRSEYRLQTGVPVIGYFMFHLIAVHCTPSGSRYRIDDTDSEDDAADGGDAVLEEEESDEEVTVRRKPKRVRPITSSQCLRLQNVTVCM